MTDGSSVVKMQLREMYILRVAVCLLALQLATSAARSTSGERLICTCVNVITRNCLTIHTLKLGW